MKNNGFSKEKEQQYQVYLYDSGIKSIRIMLFSFILISHFSMQITQLSLLMWQLHFFPGLSERVNFYRRSYETEANSFSFSTLLTDSLPVLEQ